MRVWGGLAVLAGIAIVATIAGVVFRARASRDAPTARHQCDAFVPIGDGKFQCIECGAIIDDVGDLP